MSAVQQAAAGQALGSTFGNPGSMSPCSESPDSLFEFPAKETETKARTAALAARDSSRKGAREPSSSAYSSLETTWSYSGEWRTDQMVNVIARRPCYTEETQTESLNAKGRRLGCPRSLCP